MTLRWIVAAVHLVALGIGLGAVVVRATALRSEPGGRDLRRVFAADSLWGLAALLWIGTGVARAFGGLEKGTAYYMTNSWFHFKMGCLLLILLLEILPMITLIRWRSAARRGDAIDTSRARTMARISVVQAVLVVAMVFAATAMARGFGA